MKNMYAASDFKYIETAIALENYTFGNKVKMYIPSLMTFLKSDSPRSESNRLNYGNILNKDYKNLNLTVYNSCNYIELNVPTNFANQDEFDFDEHVYKGHKGDKFGISFIGGDINKCVIIGRVE